MGIVLLLTIKVENTYGDAGKVRKYDCVGHVGKIMYNALDNFRKNGDHSASDKKLMRKGRGGNGSFVGYRETLL